MPFWDSIGGSLGHAFDWVWAFSDNDADEDYLPPFPPSARKRRARQELERPRSKAQRRSPAQRSQRSPRNQEYDEEASGAGPRYLEKQQSRPGSGVDVIESENIDAMIEDENLDLDRLVGLVGNERAVPLGQLSSTPERPRASRTRSRPSAPSRRASTERVRSQRVSVFGTLANGVKGLVGAIRGDGSEGEERAAAAAAAAQLAEEAAYADRTSTLEAPRVEFERSERYDTEDLSDGELGRVLFTASPAKSPLRVGRKKVLETPRSQRQQATPIPRLPQNRITGRAPLETPPSPLDDSDGSEGVDVVPELPYDESSTPPRGQRPNRPHHAVPGRHPPNASVVDEEDESEDAAVDDGLILDSEVQATPLDSDIQLPVEQGDVEHPVEANILPSKSAQEIYEVRLHADEWENDPNRLANHIAATRNLPLNSVQLETQEPLYAIRDVEIRDIVWQLRDQMERLADEFFNFNFRDKKALTNAFKKLDPATVLIIGCVASGGPGGEEGWRELFYDTQKRRALVCAIIGNVLVEQIFKHPLIGGTSGVLKQLEKIQDKLKDEDGFARKVAYANTIRTFLYKSKADLDIRALPNFPTHIARVTTALQTHLAPILSLNALPGNAAFHVTDVLFDALHSIVAQAGLLSLHMASDAHTVYHFSPVFKEDRYDARSMEAFNRVAMERSHPRSATTAWPARTSDAEKKRAQSDHALNQILLMDGLTTYRKGGWETSHSDPNKPTYDAARFGADVARRGFRARMLVQGGCFVGGAGRGGSRRGQGG
ncbi:hypothetical protein N0V90_009379 [Kalmusia sp. IMI 367209]|nr:hypothetical protein N0V90_009379 [Kalmusia sp. IMI 367209]